MADPLRSFVLCRQLTGVKKGAQLIVSLLIFIIQRPSQDDAPPRMVSLRQKLHSTRSTFDFVESLSAHMLDMFPFLSEVKVNRQWAGMADMTPDFAPIMGKTPVEGFYLDAGWGTWGFKATPVAGWTMSSTVANDRNHELITGFGLDRFARYALTGEKGAASVGH